MLAWRPLLATFSLASSEDEYTHILLILPVSLALGYRLWREREFEIQRWMPAAGFCLVPILLWWVAGRVQSDFELWYEMAALVVFWIACFAFCLGWQAFRALWFPLLFLICLAPLPREKVDRIVFHLQQGTIVAAEFLFRLFREPVSHYGTMITIPGLDIDVTPDCSSIRSSSILMVVTLVLAYTLLRSARRRILAVLFALTLSVAKNGLRIFVIAMLATRVDQGYLTGRLHRQGGVLFLAIAIGVELLLIWWLRRRENREGLRAAAG